jgi:hypothetical protein
MSKSFKVFLFVLFLFIYEPAVYEFMYVGSKLNKFKINPFIEDIILLLPFIIFGLYFGVKKLRTK